MNVYVLTARLYASDAEEGIMGVYSTPEAAMAATLAFERAERDDPVLEWTGNDDDRRVADGWYLEYAITRYALDGAAKLKLLRYCD